MTEKQRRKLVRDKAEEIAWGIANACYLGIMDVTVWEWLQPELNEWGELIDWERYR